MAISVANKILRRQKTPTRLIIDTCQNNLCSSSVIRVRSVGGKLDLEVLVTRRGQVTIPAELRLKYRIKQGTTIIFEDSPSGILLKVIPRLQDLIGADAGKVDLQETLKELDKMRSEDRY